MTGFNTHLSNGGAGRLSQMDIAALTEITVRHNVALSVLIAPLSPEEQARLHGVSASTPYAAVSQTLHDLNRKPPSDQTKDALRAVVEQLHAVVQIYPEDAQRAADILSRLGRTEAGGWGARGYEAIRQPKFAVLAAAAAAAIMIFSLASREGATTVTASGNGVAVGAGDHSTVNIQTETSNDTNIQVRDIDGSADLDVSREGCQAVQGDTTFEGRDVGGDFRLNASRRDTCPPQSPAPEE